MEYVLHAENLTKDYQGKRALDGLTVDLPRGKIIGLLGPNGSGKTTFMKLAAGLLTASGGELTICEKPVGSATKETVSYLFHSPGKFHIFQSRTTHKGIRTHTCDTIRNFYTRQTLTTTKGIHPYTFDTIRNFYTR